MMTCHSKIKPYSIIYSRKTQHYYVCVYNQEEDINNNLISDIYGIIITTNKKYKKLFDENRNDYNVEININGRTSYVCCDKLSRMSNNEDIILKNFVLSDKEINEIENNLNKFINEMKRQLKTRSE